MEESASPITILYADGLNEVAVKDEFVLFSNDAGNVVALSHRALGIVVNEWQKYVVEQDSEE